jgi:adenylate kinase
MPFCNKPDFVSKTLVIILLGPPGAGKGSQATLIQQHMLKQGISLGFISTGNLLRENIQKQTPLGLQMKRFIDAGELGPDALIIEMLLQRIQESDCSRGYILDGFPRTLAQGEFFQKRFSPTSDILVLNLQISDREILERLTKRLICQNCQRPYHLTFSPPKQSGICDACGGTLYQRTDDTEAVVKKRLSVYHEQTKPLIAYFQNLGLLHNINGALAKEKVFEQIVPYLGTGK